MSIYVESNFPTACSFYSSHKDNKPKVVREATWSGLVDMLAEPRPGACTYANGESRCAGKECPHKYGPAWSPVTYPEGATRGNRNVESITCAVFDIDHVSGEALAALAGALAGYAHIVHSTHNHRADDVCLRLVMPLSRPVAPADWPAVWRGMVSALCVPGDPACKDPARLFFLPVSRADVPYLFSHASGTAVDVDAMARAGANTVTAPTPGPSSVTVSVPLPPAPSDDDIGQEVDLPGIRATLKRALRAKLAEVHPDHKEKAQRHAALLHRILEHEALAEPGGRDAALNQAATIVAFICPNAAVDALVEVMRPSIGAMNTEPEGVAHWIEECRDQLNRAQDRRAKLDRERTEQAEAQRGLLLALCADAEPKVPAEALAENPDAWKALLKTHHTPNGPKVASSALNASLILRYDARVRGCFRWNEVASRIEVVGGPFAETPRASLVTAVSNWLAANYEQNLAEQVVRAQIGLVARQHPYNPVVEYLDALTWDGTSRCDEWLETYCGAVCTDDDGADITEHVRRVARRWMVSAVARALDPGCQVDTVLVLEGEQGVGKSSAFRTLAGEWFCDTQIIIGDKDSRMLAASNWIIELAELASFKRTETEQQKAFFTARDDKFRPPYSADVETFKRRCVFVGTTNDASYLVDNTGHRRFWPVTVKAIDRVGLKAARDQLWAEAVHRYRAGEIWWLEPHETEVAAAQAQHRAVMTGADVLEERVRDWWYNMSPTQRPAFVRADEIAEKVMQVTPDRMQTGILRDVRVALQRLGFEYTRRRVGELRDGQRERTYGFAAPEALRNAAPIRKTLQAVVGDIAGAKTSGHK